ncbi:flagellar biosynthetic protein FliO [Massilia sp. YIM B02769]|uniref:flagellar biosynthetic protein FliO n=1 Tax=Massilia sp. YIM B02769 TaxID=3050129 RepID=UPI0025B6D313|nr:flagellar biosynthetic protein FliO [Massilia sp. YIM B02769]MDN4057335.1 flagellar biosynthetic protein FliO [Massilia sp. YIM B02769]
MLSSLLRGLGARVMLAAACALPLAASAQAPAVSAPPAAPPVAAPAASAARPSPASGATNIPASGDAQVDIVPPERATTVGEVPTTARNPVNDPPTTVVPAAPAAIPGTPARPAAIPQPAPGLSTGILMQTIFALLMVLGLLAALAWAAKRFGPRLTGNSANLRLVGALNIGGRERIMVVEVGNQWIVVGASPGRVNALATMPRQDTGATGAAGVQSGATLAGDTLPTTNFSDWLKKTIDKRNAK